MAKARTDRWYPERIEKGRFVTPTVLQLMRQMEGKQVEVSIRERRYYTSLPQMRYYRGVVVAMIGHEMRARGGEGPYGGPITDQEVHEVLAAKFLRKSIVIDVDTGECEDIVRSTTQLTTAEMSEYIERIKVWAHIFDREVHREDGTTEVRPFIIPEAGEQMMLI